VTHGVAERGRHTTSGARLQRFETAIGSVIATEKTHHTAPCRWAGSCRAARYRVDSTDKLEGRMPNDRATQTRTSVTMMIALGAAGLAAACSSSSTATNAAAPGSEGGAAADEAGDAAAGLAADSTVPLQDGSQEAPSSTEATFRYHPQWPGAKSVSVIGGFGLASDWNEATPLVTLQDDGTGTFSGKSNLARGQYLYVFHVVGDAAGPAPDTFTRYSIDPADPDVAPCPANSPTYDKNAPNPCSQLTVPQPIASPMFHVSGMVTLDGQPTSQYLVVLERDDKSAHHFFVNRATAGSDGGFAIDAAAGQYRIQVLHPTYYTQKDASRDPVALQALRRDLSTPFAVANDTVTPPAEVGYHDYGQMGPMGAAGALPTTFKFSVVTGASQARLSIYGGKADEIGDPWFTSPLVATGGASFDGTFNTAKATTPQVVAGDRYFWGTEQEMSNGGDAGAKGMFRWTAQSMVFPIQWQ